MRFLLFIAIASIALSSCKKDKYTTAPQISFISLSPSYFRSADLGFSGPVLSLQLTDSEGDLGLNPYEDTCFVYVKNLSIPNNTDSVPFFETDSIPFPDLSGISSQKNLDVKMDVELRNIRYSDNPNRPFTDTIYFEVYVKDFAGNKSNVIKTPTPLYLVTE
jgi:hypothetical protein